MTVPNENVPKELFLEEELKFKDGTKIIINDKITIKGVSEAKAKKSLDNISKIYHKIQNVKG